jgi:hypothetical protein|tara:strand:+ start:448 stop:555 length:108 start_codon:yes stop_codon:yes gene_type:complete
MNDGWQEQQIDNHERMTVVDTAELLMKEKYGKFNH